MQFIVYLVIDSSYLHALTQLYTFNEVSDLISKIIVHIDQLVFN